MDKDILIAQLKAAIKKLLPHAEVIINENHPDHKFATSLLKK